MYYLYYLIDPITNKVRYIGITNNPERRLKEHIRDSKRKNSHKDNWIKKLIKFNLLPIQKVVLENESKDFIIQKEIDSIKEYTDLTNSTSGGEYFTFDQKVIEKLKEKNKGKNNPCYGKKWTEQEKELLRKQRKGRKLNKNWKDNIGKSAKNRIPVIINNIEYDSIRKAAKALHVRTTKIKNLIKK